MAGHDVIADVATGALQSRGEPVTDEHRAEIVRSIHEPQLGHRDPPQLPDGAALSDEAGEVGCRLLQPAGGQPLCDRGLGLALKVGVPHEGGRQGQARHGDTIAFAHGIEKRGIGMLRRLPSRMVELATCPGSSSPWSSSPSPTAGLAPARLATTSTTDRRCRPRRSRRATGAGPRPLGCLRS
jgi:hypothetical protein